MIKNKPNTDYILEVASNLEDARRTVRDMELPDFIGSVDDLEAAIRRYSVACLKVQALEDKLHRLKSSATNDTVFIYNTRTTTDGKPIHS